METNKNSIHILDQLFEQLILADDAPGRTKAAHSLAVFINGAVEENDAPTQVVALLQSQLNNRKDPVARQRGLEAISEIASSDHCGACIEPLLIDIIPECLAAVGDKSPAVKKAAEIAVKAIIESSNSYAVKEILPHLHRSIKEAGKWQEKLCALQALDILVDLAHSQLALRLPEIVPVISDSMWDTRLEVKKASHETMTKICTLISNPDIEQFIPALVRCIAEPTQVPETVHMLGATTFVQEVQATTLSIMVPLLNRGLKERETAIKRKSAVIVDNMCKLVDDPNIVAPFLPQLIPALKHIEDNIADPEVREIIKRALATLERVGNVKNGVIPEPSHAGEIKVVLEILNQVLSTYNLPSRFDPIFKFVAALAGQLIDEKNADPIDWTRVVAPYLATILGEVEAKSVVETFRKRAASSFATDDSEDDDEDEGEDLCNCDFSLAYGAKILLNRTNLRLKRGRRYGLCGPNGSGKSTLMRAISNGQVEGFPPPDELKTVYVEHDIDGSKTEITVLDFVATDDRIVVKDRTEVENALKEVGFTDKMLGQDIGSLSGGWKMKLALARAMLQKADILLLDEPTNHLDVVNVKWLEDFLIGQTDVTSVIVSHDSGFLDRVVEYIVHYERFKLKRYKGNLSEFVKRVPSAKSYYELGATEIAFSFPEPGFLEGVKTKNKAIIKLVDVAYQYPGTDSPQISGVNLQLSLSSRVAVIGPNGAGKSTMVNVLTGELVATSGEVYQHENCRIAYVHQNAFHHIDHHLDSTPSEYIQWRFQTGSDRETMDRADRVITQSDEQSMNRIYKINDTERRVVEILSRRKLKNSYEYECSFMLGSNVGTKQEKWTPMMSADNEWLPRSEVLQSHSKLVAEVDMKEALKAGQFRPLVKKEIEKHCALLGLDSELVSHSRIRGLSGGQKVKLVLAACTWQRPHIIVLDEPTNYLDRDSLGALSIALKSFEGGVIVITHNKEFTESINASEVWAVNNGRMEPSGHDWTLSAQQKGSKLTEKEAGEEFDAYGNKVASHKKKKKLTSSEARKRKKDRMIRRARGEEVFSDEDDI